MMEPAQRIVLELIRLAGIWNSFDGPKIADDLDSNQAVWTAVWFTREADFFIPDSEPYGLHHRAKLIVLRDLAEGSVSLDTVFLLPQRGKHDELEHLCASWSADETFWVPQNEAKLALGTTSIGLEQYGSGSEKVLLRVWWD